MMVPLKLEEIARWTKGQLRGGQGDETVSGVCTDSRQVRRGDLFIALKGERFDGHEFVAEAAAKGAVAAVVQRPVASAIPQVFVADPLRALGDLTAAYLRRLRESHPDLVVVAITGSSGKTTTKAMVAAILQAVMPSVASPESFNNEIGVPLTVLQTEPHHRALVLEYAMRKRGDITYLCHIAPPDIAVITNIGTAHIGLLGSRQAIAEAKAEILRWDEGDGFAPTAVLPADDDFFPFLRQKARGVVITFGFSPDAEVRGIECTTHWEGTTLKATDGSQTVTLSLPTWGEHNACNALAALAVAKILGIEWTIAAEALAHFQPPKMRLQRQWLEPPGCWVINDAYNANPDSVKAALKTLKALPARRRVAVLGAMMELGSFHEQGHREVGQVAAQTVDLLIVIGDEAASIAEGALAAGMPPESVVRFAHWEETQGTWRKWLQAGDLVLLKASRAVGLERLLKEPVSE